MTGYSDTGTVYQFPSGEPAPYVNGATAMQMAAPPERGGGQGSKGAPMGKREAGSRDRSDEWKVPGVEKIRAWIADGRQREIDSLRPEEIGSASHRWAIIKCALVDGAAYIERHIAPTMRGREFVALHLLEVFQMDTLFSDSDEGCSTISAPRMAALLGLNEKTVRRLRRLAIELHLLGGEQHRGGKDRHWPVVSRGIVQPHMHMVWWLDATSDIVRGWPAGKPRAAHHRDAAEGEVRPEQDRGQDAKCAERDRDDVDQAIAAWNAAAATHGWKAWNVSLVNARRRQQVAAALSRIGGIEEFGRALAAIPSDPFLMGRVKPKPGQARFRLTLEYLLRDDGEVPAKLLEDHAHAASRGAGVAALTPAPPPAPARPEVQTYRRGSPEYNALLAEVRESDPEQAEGIEARGWIKAYPPKERPA